MFAVLALTTIPESESHVPLPFYQITHFHRPSIPSSVRVNTLLKQLSAEASETATEDQAADHTHQNKVQRTAFELNTTEDPPTTDQMRTILEYVGVRKANQLVDGAKDEPDALRRLKEDPGRFKPPVVCFEGEGKSCSVLMRSADC